MGSDDLAVLYSDDEITAPTNPASIGVPAGLRPSSEHSFHTKVGMGLVMGRRAKTSTSEIYQPGLFDFARFTNRIINYSHDGDPYADLYLLRLEDRIPVYAAQLDSALVWLDDLLLRPANGGASINYECRSPQSVEFQFLSAYPWQGLDLVVKCDRVVQAALCARQVARITPADWHNKVCPLLRRIRNLFFSSTRYHFSGVTREDIAAETERARRVISERGLVGDSVMDGSSMPQMRTPFKII